MRVRGVTHWWPQLSVLHVAAAHAADLGRPRVNGVLLTAAQPSALCASAAIGAHEQSHRTLLRSRIAYRLPPSRLLPVPWNPPSGVRFGSNVNRPSCAVRRAGRMDATDTNSDEHTNNADCDDAPAATRTAERGDRCKPRRRRALTRFHSVLLCTCAALSHSPPPPAMNSPPSQYYFLSSPYLFGEMDAAVLSRVSQLRKQTRWVSGSSGAAPIPRHTVTGRLRKSDSRCAAMLDENGRIMMSPTVERAIADRPLLVYWSDGASRIAPFALMQAVSRNLSAAAATAASSAPAPAAAASAASSLACTVAASSTAATAAPSSAPAPCLTVGQRDAHTFCLAMGGSLGLSATLLDDKITMQQLLSSDPTTREFIPWTVAFSTQAADGSELAWRDEVAAVLAGPAAFAGESVIFKPSDSLKQKGILVVARRPESLPAVIQHVSTSTRSDTDPRKFLRWVVQSFVAEPMMLSGLDCTIMHNQTPPAHLLPPTPATAATASLSPSGDATLNETRSPSPTKGGTIKKPPANAASASSKKHKKKAEGGSAEIAAGDDVLSAAAAAAAPAVPSSNPPAPSNAFGCSSFVYDPFRLKFTLGVDAPSDSSLPLLLHGLFKVHFRIYALVVHDRDTRMFQVYACRLFKIYHAGQPSALVTSVKQEGKATEADPFSLLFARGPTSSGRVPPPIGDCAHLIDTRSVEFGVSVSNCLAMRLGNDILHPNVTAQLLPQFHSIVRASITAAISAGSFGSYGMARLGFQVLGYDFLYDTARSAPVLLEVNDNVGQGMFPKSEMLAQGMTESEYASLHAYWTREFREPFCEGVMARVIDPLFGLASAPPTTAQAHRNTGEPVFAHLASIAQPAATPLPDLYAYTRGVPPPLSQAHISAGKKKATTIGSSPVTVAGECAEGAPKARGVARVFHVPPPLSVVKPLPIPLSPALSAAPSSPFANILSVQSLSRGPPSPLSAPAATTLATKHAPSPSLDSASSNLVGSSPSSPLTSLGVSTCSASSAGSSPAPPSDVLASIDLVTLSHIHPMHADGVSNAAESASAPVGQSSASAPSSVHSSPLRPKTPAASSSSPSPVLPRPPLTIRFSSALRTQLFKHSPESSTDEKCASPLTVPTAAAPSPPRPSPVVIIRRQPAASAAATGVPKRLDFFRPVGSNAAAAATTHHGRSQTYTIPRSFATPSGAVVPVSSASAAAASTVASSPSPSASPSWTSPSPGTHVLFPRRPILQATEASAPSSAMEASTATLPAPQQRQPMHATSVSSLSMSPSRAAVLRSASLQRASPPLAMHRRARSKIPDRAALQLLRGSSLPRPLTSHSRLHSSERDEKTNSSSSAAASGFSRPSAFAPRAPSPMRAMKRLSPLVASA